MARPSRIGGPTEYLAWIERTGLSVWLRESGPAFFGSLILHALGMAFVVGVHVAVALCVLGAAPGVPLPRLRRFRPVEWAGLVVVSASGVLLLIAYPAKALTNPVFYLKLGAIVGALVIGRLLAVGVLHESPAPAGPPAIRARSLAVLSLLLWGSAIAAGRFLAYTYDVLLASHLF